MHAQHQRNFPPVRCTGGLMFTLDRVMGRGSLVDYGMFLQSIMVAARARGLHTCPQAAWNGFAQIILPHIGAGPDEMLVCGMAWAMPTRRTRSTPFTRRVCLWKNLRAGWVEPVQSDASCLRPQGQIIPPPLELRRQA
jgi:nitroreductase